MGGIGGFGGLFDLAEAGYRDPVLVSATDGVGTKLRIAIDTGRHRTIGIDLVAMCVNDLVVSGAEPLFFLDYFGTGKLEPDVAADVVAGIAEGCQRANCGLAGGETAELPGLYAAGDYDLAGFAVGAVERDKVLTGSTVAPGDMVLGIASDGLHANGFSLVRMLCAEAGVRWNDPAPFDPAQELAGHLLTPTRIYVRSCLAALKLHGRTHILDAGVRALGAHHRRRADREYPARPAARPRRRPRRRRLGDPAGLWRGFRTSAGSSPAEMATTFNCGLGMVAVVAPDAAGRIAAVLREHGETVTDIGKVVPRDSAAQSVQIVDWDRQWRA